MTNDLPVTGQTMWGQASYMGSKWYAHGRRSASIDWYCTIGFRIIGNNIRRYIKI